MYLDGEFTKEKYQALFNAAIDEEIPEAMYELGMTWAIVGSQQNDEAYITKGIAMLEKAAAKGSAEAACYLGTIYQEGKFGITSNMEKAVCYYKEGAEGGDALAMSN